MRKLGEQWVEELDGKKHMLKAVNYSDGCNGCIFLRYDSDEFYTCNRGRLGCPVDDGIIIKDLGILNEDGCLPSEFGVYPEVYEHVLMGINGYMVKAYIQDPHVGKYAWGKTKQETIDAWNRRA